MTSAPCQPVCEVGYIALYPERYSRAPMKRLLLLVLALFAVGCEIIGSDAEPEASVRLDVPPGFAPVPQPAHVSLAQPVA